MSFIFSGWEASTENAILTAIINFISRSVKPEIERWPQAIAIFNSAVLGMGFGIPGAIIVVILIILICIAFLIISIPLILGMPIMTIIVMIFGLIGYVLYIPETLWLNTFGNILNYMNDQAQVCIWIGPFGFYFVSDSQKWM